MMKVADDGAETSQGTTETGTTDGQTTGETLGQGTEEAQGGTTTDDETVVVTIGEETPASNEEENRAPEWVRDLRKKAREQERLLRDRDAEIAKLKGASAPGAVAVGDKPTLEGCDFDSDRFETELTAWHERKRKADDQADKKRKDEEGAQAAWQAKLTTYNTAKAELKVADYEDAEAVVLETLSPTQQGIIINGADKPELVIYALGKNPAKAKELASITDPVRYAFAVAKLETQLKVTPRKAPPAPEKPVRGNAPGSAVTDSNLASLEAEADRTGDRSKVIAYNREQRRKQA